VWPHYGITPEDAKAGGMNPQMFNSFLDGTKSAIEMAAVANATGLTPAPDGLAFPACGVDDLPHLLRPAADGGVLHHRGQVEVISSLERDRRSVFRDLRWGVYVTFAADSDYVRRCFKEYGLHTDASGNFSAMYKPYHLIGLELGISVAEQRRAATQMAVISQVHIARLNYANAAKQYARTDQIAKVDSAMADVVTAQANAQRLSKLESVAQRTAAILSSLRRYQALSNAQAAASRLQATLGLEPAVVLSEQMPLAEVVKSVGVSLKAWEAAELPKLPAGLSW
jgi:hypothetical protein